MVRPRRVIFCLDGFNTCICLGNNNVGSTYLDCCKLRSYVYLANLCDKLGDSRYVLNIVNVYPYNSCVCLLIAVICSSVIFCLFVFVLAYLFNCFIPNLEIQIVDQPFCKKKKQEKKLFKFISSMLITCVIFVSKRPFAESLKTRVLV